MPVSCSTKCRVQVFPEPGWLNKAILGMGKSATLSFLGHEDVEPWETVARPSRLFEMPSVVKELLLTLRLVRWSMLHCEMNLLILILPPMSKDVWEHIVSPDRTPSFSGGAGASEVLMPQLYMHWGKNL